MTSTNPVDPIVGAQSLEIVIPSDLPRGRNWAPHQFSGSVVAGRVQSMDEAPEPSPPSQFIILTDKIGDSNTCDYYRASLRTADGHETPGLVVKVLDLGHFPPLPGKREGEAGIAVADGFINAIFRTYSTLHGPALDVVPRFGGAFAFNKHYFFVFEDGGRRLTLEEMETKEVENEVAQAMDLLHTEGFVPYIYKVRCIRRGTDGRIKIVDYPHCNVRAEITPEFVVARKFHSAKTPEEGYTALCRLSKRLAVRVLDEGDLEVYG